MSLSNRDMYIPIVCSFAFSISLSAILFSASTLAFTVGTLIASLCWEWELWVVWLRSKGTEHVRILGVEIDRKLWWIVHWVLGCREMMLLPSRILWLTTCHCGVHHICERWSCVLHGYRCRELQRLRMERNREIYVFTYWWSLVYINICQRSCVLWTLKAYVPSICAQRSCVHECNRSDILQWIYIILWFGHRWINIHRFTVSRDSLLPSTATCSVGSDAQTHFLYFWASLSQHTAEGLI